MAATEIARRGTGRHRAPRTTRRRPPQPSAARAARPASGRPGSALPPPARGGPWPAPTRPSTRGQVPFGPARGAAGRGRQRSNDEEHGVGRASDHRGGGRPEGADRRPQGRPERDTGFQAAPAPRASMRRRRPERDHFSSAAERVPRGRVAPGGPDRRVLDARQLLVRAGDVERQDVVEQRPVAEPGPPPPPNDTADPRRHSGLRKPGVQFPTSLDG